MAFTLQTLKFAAMSSVGIINDAKKALIESSFKAEYPFTVQQPGMPTLLPSPNVCVEDFDIYLMVPFNISVKLSRPLSTLFHGTHGERILERLLEERDSLAQACELWLQK